MKNTLKLVIAILVLTSGCIHGPHINFTLPICLVVERPKDRTQDLALQDAIINGVAMWTKHLPDLNLGPTITDNTDNCLNPPIKVKVATLGSGNCGLAVAHETYHQIYIDPACISPVIFAHELGHTIWAYKHIADRLSVMQPINAFYPLPKDLEMLCEVHPEVVCPQFVWCEDTFEDKYRCPSPTPEAGEELAQWRRQSNSSADYSTKSSCSFP